MGDMKRSIVKLASRLNCFMNHSSLNQLFKTIYIFFVSDENESLHARMNDSF